MFIVFMGPPGAGKGTQSRRLAGYLNIPKLSTGEIFREAIAEQTELGKTADQAIHDGQLVPDQVVIDLVAEQLARPGQAEGCLLDGFPRTVEQAEALDQLLNGQNRSLAAAIQLVVPDEEIRRRTLERALVENRADDTPETIARRLAVYSDQTAPLVDFYRRLGKLCEIDGLGTPDEVFDRVRRSVDALT